MTDKLSLKPTDHSSPLEITTDQAKAIAHANKEWNDIVERGKWWH